MKINNKVVTIMGEALLPDKDLPEYVVYSNLIQNWDPPHDNESIDHHLKDQIIAILKAEFAKKKHQISD